MSDITQSAEFLDAITSVTPHKRQIEFQNMEYYNFIHFGLNTFTKKEWGSGKVDPAVFKLEDIDTDQWIEQLKLTGSRGVVITAKHHDGFCLYPSKYTDYTIASTRYRGGKGDIVAQLAESCAKYGLKLGIYLSPWDRHESTYGTDKYNDFFCNQLEELCTNYGEIFCFWFDGACGEGENGKKQIYDWTRYFDIIRRLQPNAVITNCGPDCRWIGNERGQARTSEFSVVSQKLQDNLKIAEASQQKAGATVMLKTPQFTDNSLGEREQLVGEELCWYPAEMNIPITYFGWFWRPLFEIFITRSARNLEKCYYTSVGNNATLLINVPPNNKGKLPKKYLRRLRVMNKAVNARFANKLENVVINDQNDVITFSFLPQKISTVVLREDVAFSQRVEKFIIFADGKKVYRGTTIGFKKICILPKSLRSVSEIDIEITQCRKEPHLLSIELFS